MNAPQEIEGKWLVHDLKRLEHQMLSMGAVCVQERTYENNLRFDTAEGSLSKDFKVLRLRKDTDFCLTFKGRADVLSGVNRRTEIEFNVSDFKLAKQFLEALGYSVFFRYEKYRSIYSISRCHVMLDELPYGHFVEIEGNSAKEIQHLSEQLGLNWDMRVMNSYTGLFSVYLNITGRKINNLTFKNFEGISVSPKILNLNYADSE
ncbi:MAG: class IV adenylate cyclase [Anaerolineaceae bacterium]|nr:class IV adenylate cyclase [Anaerolineaceae bacterium]